MVDLLARLVAWAEQMSLIQSLSPQGGPMVILVAPKNLGERSLVQLGGLKSYSERSWRFPSLGIWLTCWA